MLRIRVGDIAKMRKPHPCGSFEWQITRIGLDIGMKCLKCGRRVMLPREEFERRVKVLRESTE
ncbi:MAG: DUF951 domain-containing protein [Armatimonadota bacterium]|nr:DUF951 domain-containing protein [Armatimonadota bacterium]